MLRSKKYIHSILISLCIPSIYFFLKGTSNHKFSIEMDKKEGGDKPKNAQGAGDGKEKRKKESILDLSKYLEKSIRVKFAGGREAAGVLKGYDPLLNLVLDNTTEYLRDPDDPYKLLDDTRALGLVVCRGTSVVLICPTEGMEAIPNPFINQDG